MLVTATQAHAQTAPCTADGADGAAAATASAPSRSGTLRNGDLLKINVFRQKEFSGDYVIDNQGRVVIPGLGEVHAAGTTPEGVEDRLKGLLNCRGFLPDASVQAQIRISVLGEVRNAGLFPVDPGMNVLQVVTLAGGQLPDADLSKTRIMREGRTYTLDLGNALNGSSSAVPAGVVLQSGDVVLVPKKSGLTQGDWGMIFGGLAALTTAANLIVTLTRR